MSEQSKSGWRAAKGAFGDVFRAFALFPVAYIVFYAVSALQQFLLQGIETRPHEEIGLELPAAALATLILFPFCISPLRYFAAGDTNHPYGFGRPFWRVAGWMALIGVLSFTVAMTAIFLVTFLSAGFGDAGTAIAVVIMIVVYLGLIWFHLRIVTIYPLLALDERGPMLKNAFKESAGSFWFIVRAILSSLVFAIPVMLAMSALELGILIALSPSDTTVDPDVVAGFDRQALRNSTAALVVGIGGAINVVYCSALIGRIFRAIRSTNVTATESAVAVPA
jgi:hypothetical protein